MVTGEAQMFLIKFFNVLNFKSLQEATSLLGVGATCDFYAFRVPMPKLKLNPDDTFTGTKTTRPKTADVKHWNPHPPLGPSPLGPETERTSEYPGPTRTYQPCAAASHVEYLPRH